MNFDITLIIGYCEKFQIDVRVTTCNCYWSKCTARCSDIVTFFQVPKSVTVSGYQCSNLIKRLTRIESGNPKHRSSSIPECVPWRTCSSCGAAQRRRRRQWPKRRDWKEGNWKCTWVGCVLWIVEKEVSPRLRELAQTHPKPARTRDHAT